MAWCLDGMPGVSTRRKPWRCRTETSNNVIQWHNVHVQRCLELLLVLYSRDLKLAKRTLIIRSTGMLEVLPKLSRDQKSERAHQYAKIPQNPSLKAKHIRTGGQSNIDEWCTAMHCHALHALRVLWQSERNKVQRCARPRSSRSTLANLYCKGLVHKWINTAQYAAFVLDWGQVDSRYNLTVRICQRWLFYDSVLLRFIAL